MFFLGRRNDLGKSRGKTNFTKFNYRVTLAQLCIAGKYALKLSSD